MLSFMISYNLQSVYIYMYSRGQIKVYVPFSYWGRSTVRNVPLHFYGFFHSCIRTIADSAIIAFERNQ